MLMKKFFPYFKKLLLILVFAVIVMLLYIFKIPCVFRALSGIPCPACGMTRACLSFLRLDFAAALEYHSLFWTLPLIAVFFLLDGNVFKRAWINYTIMAFILSLFIFRWILLLFLL